MQRLQLYLTEEQRRRIAIRAADEGTSQAAVVRTILDRGLGIEPSVQDRLAAVDATAGLCADAPDWPDWLATVRGRSATKRLEDLGL